MLKRIEQAQMSEYTSFKAGGTCDLLLIPETVDELEDAVLECGGEFLMLGNGTDTLFLDGGYHGTVIKLGDGFSKIEVSGNRIKAGTSALLSKVANAALGAELSGLELLSGIPGSIGGAVYMNAGAYGSEIKDVIESVEVLTRCGDCAAEKNGRQEDSPAVDVDGPASGGPPKYRVAALRKDELELSYRHSVFSPGAAHEGDVILSATFDLEKKGRDEIASLMKEYTDKRNEKQPLNYPSAGSFFKRPEGHFAGKLIEDAGLKGLTVGGAMVSEKHSGFIVNTGNATATDITGLMHLVQNTVEDRFGIKLEPEVRIVGEPAREK